MSYSVGLVSPNFAMCTHPKTKKSTKSCERKHFSPILCSSSPSSKSNHLSHLKALKSAISSASFPKISPQIQSLTSTLSKIIHPPLPPTVDPKHVFTGNFAPVDELGPTECLVIEGEIPRSLNGVYIRNGPNPRHKPLRALHFTEADGMLHSLRFSNGCATYSSRYVNTYKYKLEEKAASPVIPNSLSGFYGVIDALRFLAYFAKIISGQINLMNGFGVANTSLALMGNKLLALYEADLPYEVELTDNGDVKTLGRWEIDKKLLATFTAHPKLDNESNETFAFCYNPVLPPYLSFFRFDKNGVKQKELPISSMKKPCFIHDFGVTRRFAIFQETQLMLSPFKVAMGGGQLVEHKPKHATRIGIIPKYAENDSEMKWFHAPELNLLHITNAWENEEDPDEIVLVASNVVTIDKMYEKWIKFSVEKIKIDVKTGETARETLSQRNLEFGTINSSFIGRKNRYGYFGVVHEVAKLSGVVKIDFETGEEVGKRFFGNGCFGGEPQFVPRETENVDQLDEDDGYVMTYVHDENTGESKFVLMDAKSPELAVVAAIKLPRRVPYGFHGLFVSNKNLMSSCACRVCEA